MKNVRTSPGDHIMKKVHKNCGPSGAKWCNYRPTGQDIKHILRISQDNFLVIVMFF